MHGDPVRWVTVKGKRVPITPPAGGTSVQQWAAGTVGSALGGRSSMTIGTMTDGTDTFKWGVTYSGQGLYSAFITDGKARETIRMHFKMDETLAGVANDLQDYLNTDEPGRWRVFVQELKPRKEKGGPEVPRSQVDRWKAELKQRQGKRYKTHSDEMMIERLTNLIGANPKAWDVGHGVGWKATRGQTNRGYAVIAVDHANKLAAIYPVADTGLTETGAGPPARRVTVVPMGDLVRDKRYDVDAARASAVYQRAREAGRITSSGVESYA